MLTVHQTESKHIKQSTEINQLLRIPLMRLCLIVRFSETFFVQTDERRCSKNEIGTVCPENKVSDQYRDLKLFYQKGIGEALLRRFVDSADVKNKSISHFID